MKKLLLTPLMAFILFALAMKSNAQWNLTGNANATTTSILGTTNAIPLNLTTRNLTRLVIDSNGKVGIGIAAPPNVFSVKGSGGTPAAVWVSAGGPLFTGFGEQTVGNADYILSMASTLSNARPVFIGRRSKGTLAAPLPLANNDFIMSFLSSAYDGAAFQNPAAIDFFVDGTPAAGSVPTRISFVTGTNSSNRAERLKIGNTGDISINTNQLFVQKTTGNIGVGTISPTAKIEVAGQVKITGGGPAAGKVLTSDAVGLATWQAVPVVAETDPEVAVTDTSAVPRWNGAALVNGTIKDDGTNVGIGTPTPTAKLDITGNVKIADGTQGAGKVLTSDANGLSSWQAIPTQVETDPQVSAATPNKVPKWNGTTLADGTITDNGNVGIGESNPQGILHVSQAGIFSGVVFAGTGLNDLTANINGYTGTGTTTYVIKINNAGPTPNLIQVSNNGGTTFGAAIPIANPIVLDNGVTATFAATGGHTFADQWTFSVSKGFNDLLVVDSGRVGINTKTPKATLDVVGGDAFINGLTVGKGRGNDSTNTAIGVRALANFRNLSDLENTAVGFNALFANTNGAGNTALGSKALLSNTSGAFNSANGKSALFSNTTGFNNTANGAFALSTNTTGNRNTANGVLALSANTTGSANTANGVDALSANTTGSGNTANGVEALLSNTTGGSNTANGSSALQLNTTGSRNTANGVSALFSNTTGFNNIANGVLALSSNTTGSSNVAVGYSSLSLNETGSNLVAIGDSALFNQNGGNGFNTAIGSKALFSNTTGNSNTANGALALSSNTTGFSNTANGRDALFSNTTGSSNTANGRSTLFSNTTGVSNTANGVDALRNNTTGSNNTANGRSALISNTTGFSNTANGVDALRNNTTGENNTANGVDAIRNNTTGFNNTANGVDVLRNNTTGFNNTANGVAALSANTTGFSNTANGVLALSSNTTGSSNTANGKSALLSNTTGFSNTANGVGALRNNTTGSNNVAIGDSALQNNTTGSNNVAIGDSTLANCSTGGDNTAVGAKSNPNVGASSNTTAIGANTAITGPNMVRLGASTVTSIGGFASFTNISDGRFKTKVEANVPGIEFITKLRPVTYHLDVTGIDKFTNINYTTAEQLKARSEKEQITYTGFIAQEVEAAAKSINFNFSGIDAPKNDKDMYGLRYAEFVVPLVKAVQELSKDNEQLKVKAAKVDDLQKQIDELKDALLKLAAQKTPCTTSK